MFDFIKDSASSMYNSVSSMFDETTVDTDTSATYVDNDFSDFEEVESNNLSGFTIVKNKAVEIGNTIMDYLRAFYEGCVEAFNKFTAYVSNINGDYITGGIIMVTEAIFGVFFLAIAMGAGFNIVGILFGILAFLQALAIVKMGVAVASL